MCRYLIMIALAALVLDKAALPASAQSPATRPTVGRKFTYVIVHGAWGGGWAFKDIEKRLRADGHEVYRPTLTGQGEKVHLATPDTDLTTHITDIVNVIEWEQLQEVVLVGHSYGGMVVTGVADRVPQRIKHLIYLDAFLPENGQSLNTSRGAPTTARAGGRRGGALGPTTLDSRPPPKDVPQPPRTLSEPIVLKNQDAALKIPTTYILTVDPGRQPDQDTFYAFSQRAKSRGWPVITMEGDHNIMWSHPAELIELLEKTP